MLFAGSRSEIGPLLGITPNRTPVPPMQERNQICLQSDPPQCFDIGDPFDVSIDTSSPYKTPGRGDLEKDDILNSPGYKHLLEKGLLAPPVKKADASNFFNEGTGIEKEGFDSVPDYLKNKLREMEWKKALQEDSELENSELVQDLMNQTEVPETWNEGTGIEKGGYENAPDWLRGQLWKQDLKRRQELGLEPVAY